MDRAQVVFVGLPLLLFFSDLITIFTPPPPKTPRHVHNYAQNHQSHPHTHQSPVVKEAVEFLSQEPRHLEGVGLGSRVSIKYCTSCSYRYMDNVASRSLALEKQLDRYAPVSLTADLSGLTDEDREVSALLIKAADIINDIFLIQHWKATCRAIVGISIGTLVYALAAVSLGAPVGTIRNLKRTVYWSVLMSLFTVVPAACNFGISWCEWRRVFALRGRRDKMEQIICMSGYGAVIGAWFGAWPMPLDCEQPWQEWPVCVSYGSIAGYFIGFLASFFLPCPLSPHPIKSD